MNARVGRRLDARLRVRGWLRLESPLHVGAARGDEGAVDVAVDGLGRLILPGTGLAGPLRAYAERLGDQQNRWGYAEHGGRAGDASRVRVDTAVITLGTGREGEPAEAATSDVLEPRSGNGIDRYTGTAAAGILRERLVVPAGLFLRLRLDVEATWGSLDDDRWHLAALLRALGNGRIHLGGGTGGGLGRISLGAGDVQIIEEDLSSRAGLLAMMRGVSPVSTEREFRDRFAPTAADDGLLTVRVDWEPALPVMSAGPPGVAVDVTPLTTGHGTGEVRLTLPGTSIKGVLRSHAERIMRTIADETEQDVPPPTGDIPERAAQFRRQHTGDPLVNLLFGTAALSPLDPAAPADGTGGAGVLDVEECYATTPIPRKVWQRVLTDVEAVGDRGKRLPEAVRRTLAGLGMSVATHNAIDRWTGGTAPGALFTVLEPFGVTWQPIEVTVDLTRMPTGYGDAALALLLHVLHDLRAGLIPFGYGINRGFGDIVVKEINLTGPTWPDGADIDTVLSSETATGYGRAWERHLTRTAGRR